MGSGELGSRERVVGSSSCSWFSRLVLGVSRVLGLGVLRCRLRGCGLGAPAAWPVLYVVLRCLWDCRLEPVRGWLVPVVGDPQVVPGRRSDAFRWSGHPVQF